MTSYITEAQLEQLALDWFAEIGYTAAYGPDLAPDGSAPERESHADVILIERLRAALERINAHIPAEGLDDALRQIQRSEGRDLLSNNRRFHRMLANGVEVEYRRADGSIAGGTVWLVDYAQPSNNDWLVVNQFTVVENRQQRRLDLAVFVNGLPLGVIELKNPSNIRATLRVAYNQLQAYQQDLPTLFQYTAVCAVSDGLQSRTGTIGSSWERFMPWRTIDGEGLVEVSDEEFDGPDDLRRYVELEVLIKGVFDPYRFPDLARNFIVFEDDGAKIIKKMAAYHQFHAVNKAIERTVRALPPAGDQRIGVVWHTQGSGKSLTMVFYTGKLIKDLALANPTVVVLTDRNDLDDQLYGTFARCADLLRQTPQQAASREDLREKLRVASGGVIFTTVQKFLPDPGRRYPRLSDRRNIVVIADEAHRSQYDFVDGFARHLRDALPHASFIGFTGTPIEASDKSTPAVFGDYIDVYDIRQAVEDGATVRIYYEARLAKLALDEEERPYIDPAFEEVTEGEEQEQKQQLRSRWSRLEALVGADTRVEQAARDIVTHFEARLDVLNGKGIIVAMSRRICVDLYNAMIALRPHWHSDDDAQGVIKVVMTARDTDPPEWRRHTRTKPAREALGERLKNPDDPLKLVIVRDMWLTGFDAPCLHTMYVDKPMRGHGLMQAIARVNRVFKDKPGGLVVDYLGLSEQLQQALLDYTARDRAETAIPQETAMKLLREKHEIVRDMFHGFDYAAFAEGHPATRLLLIRDAVDHILAQDDGKRRLLQQVSDLSAAFALVVPNDEALQLRDDIVFFQAVRAALVKTIDRAEVDINSGVDTAVRQIVAQALVADEVIDVFASVGMQRPNVSILSDEFLADVRGMPQRNLALEVLRKLLNDSIKARQRTNVVEARSFSEMLDQAILRYQNRTIDAAEVIAELVELARQVRESERRGEALGMSAAELAFYDALETNDSAVKVMGDTTLRAIARELVEAVRRNVTIDWTLKESAQARLRVLVKRVLRRYGYPPDKQEQATKTVLEQAAALSGEWALEEAG
jgi:type I restriction enzyme R subunit